MMKMSYLRSIVLNSSVILFASLLVTGTEAFAVPNAQMCNCKPIGSKMTDTNDREDLKKCYECKDIKCNNDPDIGLTQSTNAAVQYETKNNTADTTTGEIKQGIWKEVDCKDGGGGGGGR